MNNPIILTAAQAQELHTTGRLTGYREKCEDDCVREWTHIRITHFPERPPMGEHFGVEWFKREDFTGIHEQRNFAPPRDTDTAYAVKEPCALVEHAERTDGIAFWDHAIVVYTDDRDADVYTSATHPDHKYFRLHGETDELMDKLCTEGDGPSPHYPHFFTADEMPDWAIRQRAQITDIKLIISDGELWWDFGDLEKVAKA